MTRKHFQALAQALLFERPGEHWDANKRMQWNMDVKAITRVLKSTNEHFDETRFLSACGGLFEV